MQRVSTNYDSTMLKDGYVRLSSLEDLEINFCRAVMDKLKKKGVEFVVADGRLYGKRGI